MQHRKHKKLTFHDYLTYYSDGCAENLTISQLKQEDIVEAVRHLHMIPPVRSTITTNLVPLISLHAASLSVQEVTKDMRHLGWEEILVQAVKTVEPMVPSTSLSPKAVAVPETDGYLKEKDQGGPLVRALPSWRFSKKARTVRKKHAGKYSWCFRHGCTNISDLPYKWCFCQYCNAGRYGKKHIDVDADDPSFLIATYEGKRNHTP